MAASGGSNRAEHPTDSEEPAPKRFCSSYTSTVIVLVGPEQFPFTAYNALLCKHSGFFRAACAKERNDQQQRNIHLPESSPENFQIYLDWCYSRGKSNVKADIVRLIDADSKTVPSRPVILEYFCDLWIMGDYLQDLAFTNLVMSCLVIGLSNHCSLLPATLLKRMAIGTRQTSGIYRLAIDHMACRVTADKLKETHEWMPAEIIYELLEKTVAVRPRSSKRVPGDVGEYFEMEKRVEER